MEQLKQLKTIVSSAPDSPGVYLMRDISGQVIYVGKANSLKKRLQNYLARDLPAKTQALMAKVFDIEFRLAPNEELALLLEYKLIHEFRPWYNISLKDDKGFPFVRISPEEFPSIQVTRKKDAGGRLLGPYTNTNLLKGALKIIRREFAFRTCLRLPKKSCVYYRINLCPAPCIGKIGAEDYRRLIGNLVMILEGRGDLLIRKLAKSMQEKSAAHDFEAAARLRDQMITLSGMSAKADAAVSKNEVEELRKFLGLKNLPFRIEGFDISNISGKSACGSMVSFFKAKPDKNNYRRFRIRTVSGIDDYKMLAEVLGRRYRRLLREKTPLPDLLLIDGGKGHILTAWAKLRALGLQIPLVSIAKEKENIYRIQRGKLRVVATKEGAALNLIRRIRDEAHRFALA